jgi:hypothetical protein
VKPLRKPDDDSAAPGIIPEAPKVTDDHGPQNSGDGHR